MSYDLLYLVMVIIYNETDYKIRINYYSIYMLQYQYVK